jgi:L-asparaginase II
MNAFRVESTRGSLVESVHPISAAVVDSTGRLLASVGDPDLATFWRSAAKPFQSLPLVADGAADAFGFDAPELALACASHSSERVHLDTADRMLRKAGCAEEDLACGPHPPLSPQVAEMVARSGTTLTPRWSNCSGKHAGMLAVARHAGWPTRGYERAEHPVQRRVLEEVARWCEVPAADITVAVDGCTAACFGLGLRQMAAAYARFAASSESAPQRLRRAMTGHPVLVAGTGRLCTDLMNAGQGEIIAKVGAEGVYSAAHAGSGIGITLKVEDGDMRSAPVALLGVLRALVTGGILPSLPALDAPLVARHAEIQTCNTRGAVTGVLRAAGALRIR